MQVDVKNLAGEVAGQIEVSEFVFGIEPNTSVMHQALVRQHANQRRGTHSTLTRGEVSGGGRKPWKQKGTGRARAGSSRSPIWRGGGVALGPKPRSYEQRTPKKMKRLALASALSDRVADEKVVVVDAWGFDTPRTKDAVAALGALDVSGKALIVLTPDDVTAWKSFRNLTGCHVLTTGELNTYDVLVSDYVVFTKASLPGATPPAAAVAAEPATAPAGESPEETAS